jgi:anti-sigma factor RsiW
MNREECKILLSSLSEYMDGELEDTLCAEIEKHLAECERCRVVVDTLNKTISLYHTADSHLSVPEGIRQRLFMRLDLDEYLKR